jgi:sialate O-acetylesterase
MIHKFALIAAVTITVLFMQFRASAQNVSTSVASPLPFISPIFGDNMVLQRGKTNTIWGWSEPGDKVEVEIQGKHASAIAGADRRWAVKFSHRASAAPTS